MTITWGDGRWGGGSKDGSKNLYVLPNLRVQSKEGKRGETSGSRNESCHMEEKRRTG